MMAERYETGQDLFHKVLEKKTAEAMAEIDAGVSDARADFPGMNDDDLYYEIMNSVIIRYSPSVRKEVRFRMGFDWRE